jgi:dTDP-4-amino-4,6-dideoxygalactose transaminase
LIGSILASAGRGGDDRPLAILPAFTFVATASAVEQCGYRPHVADVQREDWTLAPQALARHPMLHRIGLVVAVSPFGRPVAQAAWAEFRRTTGIPVVIDAAAGFEALGAQPGQLAGDIPVALSFHATKAYATGEGGAVVTTDAQLAARVTRALNFGFYEDRESRGPSTNGKMSEYHAAVGLAGLDEWPSRARAFRAVAEEYVAQLATVGLGGRAVSTWVNSIVSGSASRIAGWSSGSGTAMGCTRSPNSWTCRTTRCR